MKGTEFAQSRKAPRGNESRSGVENTGPFTLTLSPQHCGERGSLARETVLIGQLVAALITAVLLVITGCSHRPPRPGEVKVVETSGRKPGWVKSEEPSFREDDVWFFRGQAFGVTDLTLGLRQAEADAKKRIVGKIVELVASEYSEYALGTNMSEDEKNIFVSDGISWASESVPVSGVAPAKVYWERLQKGRGYGVGQGYNAYVLVALSVDDYEEARRRAIRRVEEKARAANNRRAEEAAKRLRERLGWE